MGAPTVCDSRQAIELHTLARHRSMNSNQHYWRGQPGLWRKLLTKQAAEQIAAAQTLAFQEFGYECDADPLLTSEAAESNWQMLRVS